ncbi:hypothetical protein Tco_0777466 [Tanacetum coccineum]
MAPSLGPTTISLVQTKSITTKPCDLLFRHDKWEIDDTTPSEEYDGEREKEPMPIWVLEIIPILQAASSRVQRQKERVVKIEDAPNKEGSKVERNDE